MKTLHQQQDSHHKSDSRNKNILNSNKKEGDLSHHKSNASSLFPPFNHFGMNNHSSIPVKTTEKAENTTGEKAQEITSSIAEAYNKQVELSLDAAQKFHKEFVDQITTLYNFNQQFWSSVLYSHK